MTKIYITSPYSHPDPDIRERRFRQVACYAGMLIEQGHRPFSPIAHSHPIVCNYAATPDGLEAWMKQDLPMIDDWADRVHVLKIDGWDMSPGVDREIYHSRKHAIGVEYIDPPELVIAIGNLSMQFSPADTESILDEAKRITDGSRQADYDHPKANHERIARLWNSYLTSRKVGGDITAADASIMMILLKIARACNKVTRDTAVDVAGYARVLARIVGVEK